MMAREELQGYPEYKIIKDTVDGIPVTRVVNNFTRLQKRYLYDYHPRIEEIFKETLSRTRPDLVHVQHLAGASWGIPSIVKDRGIPLVISLHDYWYACERVQLLRPDGTICPGPEGGLNCAVHCAHGAPSFMASAVMERVKMAAGICGSIPGERIALGACALFQRLLLRGNIKRLVNVYGDRCGRLLQPLSSADALVSPSEKARSIYTAMGVPAGRHVVIPHGLPAGQAGAGSREGREYDGKRPLMLGYAGNIMAHKGLLTLLRAVRAFSPSRVRLKMFGRSYPPRYASFITKVVKRFPEGQVKIHGTYQPSDLPEIFAGLDLLVIPPLWHETFNLVLWEAWGAGLPVIVSRVGALADFVKEGVGGLTFSPGNWRELRAAIERVIQDPQLPKRLGRDLPRTGITLEENTRIYEQLFLGLVGS